MRVLVLLLSIVPALSGCAMRVSPLAQPLPQSTPANCTWVVGEKKAADDKLYLCCADPSTTPPGHLEGSFNPVCWGASWVEGLGHVSVENGAPVP